MHHAQDHFELHAAQRIQRGFGMVPGTLQHRLVPGVEEVPPSLPRLRRVFAAHVRGPGLIVYIDRAIARHRMASC